MILGGMWHGARMNFVLWGVYQGVLLCLYRLLEPYIERIEPARPVARRLFTFACWFLFFHLVCYGWLLFRAETGAQILAMTANLPIGWSNLTAHVRTAGARPLVHVAAARHAVFPSADRTTTWSL